MKQINTLLSIYFLCLLVVGCVSFHKNQKNKQQKFDKAKKFFQLTENYSNDTMMFNRAIDREKARYVNQRTFKDWDKIKANMQEYYLHTFVLSNLKTLIDSISIDTMNLYINNNEKYRNREKIYAVMPKRDVYRAANSLFIEPLLENKEEKFSKLISDNCNRFRSGKFEEKVSDLITFKIDRTEAKEHTYSDHDDDQWFSKIKWIANNRYLLMTADRNWPNPNYDSSYVNIYETTDSSYYFVLKNLRWNEFYEGYIVKIK